MVHRRTPIKSATQQYSLIVALQIRIRHQIDLCASTTDNEMLRFWQHMANANVLDGDFSGVVSGAAGDVAAIWG